MRVLVLIITFLLAGCEKYRENPDFPFPQINDDQLTEEELNKVDDYGCPKYNHAASLKACTYRGD